MLKRRHGIERNISILKFAKSFSLGVAVKVKDQSDLHFKAGGPRSHCYLNRVQACVQTGHYDNGNLPISQNVTFIAYVYTFFCNI